MSFINIEEPITQRPASFAVFFAAGFRPFFLFTALQAMVALPLWLAVYVAAVPLNLPFADAYWHGHEMMFGFAAAAIAGFLLTAVPNWTGSRPVSGLPLIALFAIWCLGRIAVTASGYLPLPLVALIDLAYLPVLMVLVGRPLVAAKKIRNLAFIPILGLFWLFNVAFYAHALWSVGDALVALYGAMTVILSLIVIIGGRVIPSFTQNWLHMQGRARYDVSGYPWIERGGAIASLVIAMLLVSLWPDSVVSGMALLVAALIQGLRMSRWHGWRTAANPIVWILHVGYGWLVVGLVLMAISCFTPALPISSSIHAMTAGAIASMIMAIMSRASLGHSGRPLKVGKAMIWAYSLLSVGTILRLIAPLFPTALIPLTHSGGSLWSLAWLIFAIVYWPILTRPRLDGRPG
jgi:uncharacterized protein involved in response to NO